MTGQSDGVGQARTRADDGARVAWVDAAKGVGILLVVIGHVWRGPVRDAIYTFHMPLFFILSGYMVTPQPFRALLKRQARSLLVPFAAFSLMLIAGDFLIEGARGVRPIFAGWGDGIATILFRTGSLGGPFSILWFIPCLFVARLAWNLVARCWPNPVDWRWAALVAVMMVAAHGIAARSAASPFGLFAVPAAFTCYWVGQLWRDRPPVTLPAVAILVLLGGVALMYLPPIDLKKGYAGVPFLSLAGAAGLTILLCLGLARLPGSITKPLAWIGRASLVIMYLHLAFIHYCTPYMGKGWLLVVAICGSVIAYLLARASRPGRIILLGERN